MAETWNRICIKEQSFSDPDEPEKQITLERGKEYLTGAVDENGEVAVLSRYWFKAPIDLFAGEKRFT